MSNGLKGYLLRHSKLIKHFSSDSKHQNSMSMPLDTLLSYMKNLVSLNMQGCTILYCLDFLKCTRHITELNVSSCPSMSTFSMVKNVPRLQSLQVFKCDNNDWRVSAYSIYQAVCGLTCLTYLTSKNSGVMRPWILRMIFAECPNLSTCLFTTLFSMDTENHKYDWYDMVRNTYSHIKFPDAVVRKVVEYEDSCELIKFQKKKKIHHPPRSMV